VIVYLVIDLEIADLVEENIGTPGEPSQVVAPVAAVTAEDNLEIRCLEPVADRRHLAMVDPDRAHGHPLVAHDADTIGANPTAQGEFMAVQVCVEGGLLDQRALLVGDAGCARPARPRPAPRSPSSGSPRPALHWQRGLPEVEYPLDASSCPGMRARAASP
jgi:hypothetical protein